MWEKREQGACKQRRQIGFKGVENCKSEMRKVAVVVAKINQFAEIVTEAIVVILRVIHFKMAECVCNWRLQKNGVVHKLKKSSSHDIHG